MVRLGLRFENPPPVQAAIDRYVFALLRRKQNALRPLQPGVAAERRVVPRIEVSPSEGLSLELLPDRPRGALTAASTPAPVPVRLALVDLSTTGCSVVWSDPSGPKVGDRLHVRLQASELDVRTVVRVMNQVPLAV